MWSFADGPSRRARQKNVQIRAGMDKIGTNTKEILTINTLCGIFQGPGGELTTHVIECSEPIQAKYIRLVIMKKSEVKCEYWKGGVCVHHGPGAKRKWRPKGTRTIVDKNGVSRKECVKEYYYVCDPVSRGREKMNQTVLSFNKPTQRNNNTLMSGMVSDENTTPSVGK